MEEKIICDCGTLNSKNFQLICLDCGQLTCEECFNDKCINTIIFDRISFCNCGEYTRIDDISNCKICNCEVCLKCQIEYKYNYYCENCIKNCAFCGLETKYYKNKWICDICQEISCSNCLNEIDQNGKNIFICNFCKLKILN